MRPPRPTSTWSVSPSLFLSVSLCVHSFIYIYIYISLSLYLSLSVSHLFLSHSPCVCAHVCACLHVPLIASPQIDQQTLGHQFLLSVFGPDAIPRAGWQACVCSDLMTCDGWAVHGQITFRFHPRMLHTHPTNRPPSHRHAHARIRFLILIQDSLFSLCSFKNLADPSAQIDPFGHSTTMAALYAMMGMDSWHFGRIDYQVRCACAEKGRKTHTHTNTHRESM
jgi:hypothetical protein